MTVIQDLPAEIISKIFTLGCDLDDDVVELPEHPRRLKTFALPALSVCKSWDYIVKNNSHFWVCYITIEDRSDIVPQVIDALTLLRISEGSDIDLNLTLDTGEDDVDLSSNTPRAKEILISLDFPHSSSKFIRQWRNVHISAEQPEIFHFMFSILDQAIVAPRLVELALISQSERLSPMDPRGIVTNLRASDPLGDVIETPAKQTVAGQFHFSSINLETIRSLPRPRKLILSDCDPDGMTKLSAWKHISDMVPALECLDLRSWSALLESYLESDVVCSRKEFDFLNEFIFSSPPLLLRGVLGAFDFRSLTFLSITVIEPYGARIATLDNIPPSTFQLPSLQRLSMVARCNVMRFLLPCFASDLPRLSILEATINTIISNQELLNASLHHPEHLILAPKCIILPATQESFLLLSLFDFTNTESLSMSHCETYYIYRDYISLALDSTPRKIPMLFPNLSSLKLTPDCATPFFCRSTVHSLHNLELTSILPHRDTLWSWEQSPPVINLWELWTQLKAPVPVKLRIDLSCIDFSSLSTPTSFLTLPVNTSYWRGILTDCHAVQSSVVRIRKLGDFKQNRCVHLLPQNLRLQHGEPF